MEQLDRKVTGAIICLAPLKIVQNFVILFHFICRETNRELRDYNDETVSCAINGFQLKIMKQFQRFQRAFTRKVIVHDFIQS